MKKKIIFLLPALLSLTGCTINISGDDIANKLFPNWVSFVVQLGALVVLILVVLIFGYKPIKKIINKRQDHIMQNIKEAEESKAIWQQNELESKEKVLASSRTAADIVAEAKAEANKERDLILEQTRVDVEKMKKDAENDIARMEVEAKEQIRKEMVSVALDASKELLGREVSSKDNDRLLEEFIEEIENK